MSEASLTAADGEKFMNHSIGFAFVEKFGYRHADLTLGTQGQVFDWKIDDLGIAASGTNDLDRFPF